MFDVCVVGHVTRDIVQIGNRQTEMPGGTACYASLAMKFLGMDVAVVTTIGKDSKYLLEHLYRNNISVFFRDSPRSTTFINNYTDDMRQRIQRVTATALPFTIMDIRGIRASVFHLGPLNRDDISPDIIRTLSARSTVSLDVQGFLRTLHDGQVVLTDWPDKEEALRYITILKTDEEEARILSGETDLERMAARLSGLGPREVIITRGNKGSLIYSAGRSHTIPAYAPQIPVDPTGCGDTYMAGYLFMRLITHSPAETGDYAARLATTKLERSGPLY